MPIYVEGRQIDSEIVETLSDTLGLICKTGTPSSPFKKIGFVILCIGILCITSLLISLSIAAYWRYRNKKNTSESYKNTNVSDEGQEHRSETATEMEHHGWQEHRNNRMHNRTHRYNY